MFTVHRVFWSHWNRVDKERVGDEAQEMAGNYMKGLIGQVTV